MNTITKLIYRCDDQSISLLQKGDASAFTKIYKNLYPVTIRHVLSRVKNDLVASIITQDAFLMLWILHNKINDSNKLNDFLKKQLHFGCTNFYTKAVKFYNSLISLDDIENYQAFMCGYIPDEETEPNDETEYSAIDTSRLQQWNEVLKFLPTLTKQQQLHIQLCLKHSFNYDEIANRLGGITAYQVGRQVDATLKEIKMAVVNAKKLNHINNLSHMRFEGQLTAEQINIMQLRYEMNLCFAEISKKLKLPQPYVQKTFVEACIKVKNIKSNAKSKLSR